MSYKEKRTVATIVSGLLMLAAYCIYAFVGAGAKAGGNDLKFWGTAMLIFVGIGIAATIVIQIIYHIAMSISIAIKEKEFDEKKIGKALEVNTADDEMDKLIQLKSERVCSMAAGVGFVGGLVSLAFGASAAVMLNALYLAGSVGCILQAFISLHYYRKGVRNA